MTEREDLRLVAGPSDKWIVRRHRAIVVKTKHFAGVRIRILRAAAVAAARRRHIELAVAAPCDPRRTRHAGTATEDVLELGDRLAFKTPTRDGQRGLSFGANGLQIGEIDESIRGELRMQHNVEEP